MRISFYDYMVDNYLEDDSKYSDLAEDMEMDLEIDEQETDVEKLREYFKSKIEKDYIMKVVEDCLEAYENDRWI
ncbi:YozE family protein [Staphylococcus pseudoxylosus]|uniref:YozE family protein n=1 Tax=Staphylococcus pseudoxylosus TaxID=2282419 RepID=UPI003015CBDA